MAAVFSDDAPIEAQRETLARQLLDTLPVAYRIPMRGVVMHMVAEADAPTLKKMRDDLQAASDAAARNDLDAILQLARHWASDEQIAAYLPSVKAMLNIT